MQKPTYPLSSPLQEYRKQASFDWYVAEDFNDLHQGGC